MIAAPKAIATIKRFVIVMPLLWSNGRRLARRTIKYSSGHVAST
jgi:hypothetical protein